MTADELAGLGSQVFVTDFDGTMTGVDFYEVVQHHANNAAAERYWHDLVAGRITHVEALDGIFHQAPHDEAELIRWLPETRLDPATPQAVKQLRDAGWDIVVVSAGSEWYIRKLLAPVANDVHIIANPGGYSDERGLWMDWPPKDVPWYCPHFGVDKAKIVQQLLDQGSTVAFAGDGRPDRKAMEPITADLRFARGWLAEVLTADGLAFQPFTVWSEIAQRLLGYSRG